MNKIDKFSWMGAIYFLLFEIFFWKGGIDFVRAVQRMLESGKPLIAQLENSGVFYSYGVFNSYPEMLISLTPLILSAWCMKQFVKTIIGAIRSLNN